MLGILAWMKAAIGGLSGLSLMSIFAAGGLTTSVVKLALIGALGIFGLVQWNASISNAVNSRDRVWEARLTKEIATAQAARKAVVDEADRRVDAVEKGWADSFKKLSTYSDQLETLLKESEHANDAAVDELQKKQCVSAKTVAVIRDKVRQVNRTGALK